MALNFVGGKPVKAIEQPKSLEEAMTPLEPKWAKDMAEKVAQHTDAELAKHLTDKIDEIKAKVTAPYPVTMQEPGKAPVYVNVTQTVAPAPSMPLDGFILGDNTHVHLHDFAGVAPPPGTVLADGTTTYLSKLQIPVSELTVEDQVKLSQDQEPQSIAVEQAHSEVLTLVDEYTELQAEIDAVDISAQLKAQETIKKRLSQIAKSDNYPSNKPVQLCGTHGNYVEFSAAANSVKITDKAGMAMYLGAPVWIEHTDMTLAEAKKILSENELAKYTSNVPGSRTLKTVYKG